jgi:hypothetical protein
MHEKEGADRATARLLNDITHCDNIARFVAAPAEANPCAKIVALQQRDVADYRIGLHRVPEPWSGHLSEAPILFLAANPSADLGFAADFPYWSSPEGVLVDIFERAFETSISDDIYPVSQDGSRSARWVRNWAFIRGRARELIPGAKGGKDYVVSDIVHCKSRSREGVTDQCALACGQKWLRKVVTLSGASVIIGLGIAARSVLPKIFSEANLQAPLTGPVPLAGRARYVAFLPHSNAHQRRTILGVVGEERTQELIEFLAVQTN